MDKVHTGSDNKQGMSFFSSGASRDGVQATSKQGQKQTIICQTSILTSTEDMS